MTFRFEHVHVEPMHGEMIAFDPPRLIEFTWGPDRLRFELAPDGDGTLMTFTVVLDELARPLAMERGGTSRWRGLIERSGMTPRAARPEHWRSLRDAYAERFGPEASVLGPPEEWEAEYGSL